MSSDTQFKASDSVSEVSHAQQNTPNINVLDLFKGAQPRPNDSVGTAKDYLPSMTLTGNGVNSYGGPLLLGPIGQGQPVEQGQPTDKFPSMTLPAGPLLLGPEGQPTGQIQDVNSLPSMRQPFEPFGEPIQPLGQPIEYPIVIGTVSPPTVIGTASPPIPVEQPIHTNPMAPYLM